MRGNAPDFTALDSTVFIVDKRPLHLLGQSSATFTVALQNLWETIADSNGDTVVADSTTDTFTFSNSDENISIEISGDGLIIDLNSESSFWATYIYKADENNSSRLYYTVIADFNEAVLYSQDWNQLGITDDVNSWINALTFGSTDFNLSYAKVDRALSTMGLDADFNLLYAKVDRDLATMGLSTDFNGIYKNTDTNYATAGIINSDTNGFNIDVNAGGNSMIEALDINATNIYIQTTGDMNFFVFNKNVTIQTASGMVEIIPDKNMVCMGNNPIEKFCFWNSDSNGYVGWI